MKIAGDTAESTQNFKSFKQILHLFNSDVYFWLINKKFFKKSLYILPYLFFVTKHILMKKL